MIPVNDTMNDTMNGTMNGTMYEWYGTMHHDPIALELRLDYLESPGKNHRN